MHRALIETDSLEELAAEGKRMPLERLKQLEAQLPLTHDVAHDTGVFDALVYAMNSLTEGEKSWLEMREKAAAAAAHVILYRAVYRSIDGETGTPEFFAASEEHVYGLMNGRVPSVPAEDVLREMDELTANYVRDHPKR